VRHDGIASDIPVLRDVGFDGVTLCPLTDVSEWERVVVVELCGRVRRRPSN